MNGVIMMMIGVSIGVFFVALGAFLCGIKNKQFDEEYKFTSLDDSEEALHDAQRMQAKKEEALKRKKEGRG